MSLDITLMRVQPCEVHWQNITHNLGPMAERAGLYGVLWHPEDHGIKVAVDLIAPLTKGIEAMKADPARFKALNAPNGWGTYDNFVPWLERLLSACREYPDATVEVSR
jgi:hypothetical protein